jgi:HD superfamily phosphohydrolase
MITNAISHPRAITTIREPIHGAIDLTCFEREIVDSPYFQRLHFVLQNSTTYTAYPSNKNSRFIHSIGVASVVGDMLVASLRNSPKDELAEFLTQAAEFIFNSKIKSPGSKAKEERSRNRLLTGWKSTIYGHSAFSHRSFMKDASQPLCPEDLDAGACHGLERDFIVDTLWEACRLCGLIHDIGHLPMSHSFEMALKRIDSLLEQYDQKPANSKSSRGMDDSKIVQPLVESHHELLEIVCGITSEQLVDFLLNDIEVHERRSLLILQYIWDADAFGCNGDADDGDAPENPIGNYRDLIYELAILILYASSLDGTAIEADGASLTGLQPSFPPFVRVLKTIIAGEVDADRMDYTIRDGHACGSEIGNFDINRVISNAVLRKDGDRFRVMYYERAISGLEHFFTQRHDGYKYLIYHRTSSRTEACLQELLGRLLHASIVAPNSIIAKRLVEFGYIEIASSQRVSGVLPFTKEAMISLDDSNLRTMCMFLRRDLSPHRKDEDYSGLPNELIWPICCLLDVLSVRDFDSVMSPYKNHHLENELKQMLADGAGENDDYKSLLEDDSVSIKDRLSDALSSSSRKAFTNSLRSEFQTQTGGKAILLISYQKPKVFAKGNISEHDWLYVVEHSGDFVPLTDRSPLLTNMWENLKRSSGISMCIISQGVKSSTDEMNRMRHILNTVLLDALIGYQKNSTSDQGD